MRNKSTIRCPAKNLRCSGQLGITGAIQTEDCNSPGDADRSAGQVAITKNSPTEVTDRDKDLSDKPNSEKGMQVESNNLDSDFPRRSMRLINKGK